MANTKVTGFTANTTPDIADVLPMIDAPGTVPANNKITFQNFLKVINGLTATTSVTRSADYLLLYQAGISDVRKVLSRDVGAYMVKTGFQNVAPADATTYYFGSWENLSYNTTANERKIYILRAGQVLGADVLFRQTAGSGETSTMSIRLNNTTDTTISAAITNNAAETHFSNTGLGITVAVGDAIEIKWVTPTWVTNPTGVYCQVRLLIA